MVRRGLVTTPQQAHELIAAGRVTVAGAPALKATRQVRADEPLHVLDDRPRFVSRAGEKLAAAVERFDLAGTIAGARALDAGASTGGFTDCLLQNGAAHVVAVDVGYGLLHERVAGDPRVEVRDRTNVRDLVLDEPVDVVVGDLSFISLRAVLPALLAAARPGATLVLLVKPQFEATREEADRARGVIRDPEVWRRVLLDAQDALAGRGATIMGAMVSPLHGADGNVEFLLHVRAPGPPGAGDGGGDGALEAHSGGGLDVDALVREAGG